MTSDVIRGAPCFWVRVPYEGHVEIYAHPQERNSADLARYAVWLSRDPQLEELLRHALRLAGDDGC
jgi:hypothetical protein